MRLKIGTILFAITMVISLASAQRAQVILGPGKGNANFRVPFHQPAGTTRTLSKDTTYVLTGWYFVDSTANFVIQPGTLILGDKASGGTLIIKRGAKINAAGTASSPIVFTSDQPSGNRNPGDWGGIILLGNAPTNKPTTQQIEGGFGTGIPNSDASFGGSDPNDSSGVMRYVRIEFPGIAFAQDNEINGLTLAGVGRKTKIEYIQVSYSGDDSYEFFGGNVDMRYLVAYRGIDDEFDTDFGYSGRLQFLYGKRDPNYFDAGTGGESNGFESDNEGSAPYTATPRTSPVFSNLTMVGPKADTSATVNPRFGWGALIRRASELSIFNSVIMGYPKGIDLRDTLTQRAASEGRLQIKNTSLQAQISVLNTTGAPATPIINFPTWFTTSAYANRGATPRNTTDIGLMNAFSLSNQNDPRPSATSELATAGTDYTSPKLDPTFFTAVSYRGAFDPSKPMSQQWTATWSNFDPQNTNYSNGVFTGVDEIPGVVPASFELSQNYPNPFNPNTTINYSIPQNASVKLTVYDMLGREVQTLVSAYQNAGAYRVQFDASGLASGLYLYRLSAGAFQQTLKMVLTK